jgi:hypothetical protein
VPTIAVPLQNLQKNVTSLPYLKKLKLAHPLTDSDVFEIEMLIGADAYWEIVQDRVIRGNGQTAVQSKIGFLLSGPLPVGSHIPTTTSRILLVMTSPPETSEIERFWKLESLGINPDDDGSAASGYLHNYQKDSISFLNGRYTAKLPWKEDHPPLPTNYEITKKRTMSQTSNVSDRNRNCYASTATSSKNKRRKVLLRKSMIQWYRITEFTIYPIMELERIRQLLRSGSSMTVAAISPRIYHLSMTAFSLHCLTSMTLLES